MMKKFKFIYEPDKEIHVFAKSEEAALRFFGLPLNTPIRKTERISVSIWPDGSRHETPGFAIESKYVA
jgi:hypothetical protein